VVQTYAAAAGTLNPVLPMNLPTLTANANYTNGSGSPIIGSIKVNAADKFVFIRGAAPVANFNANINLTLNVSDASESGVNGAAGSIATSVPLVFASVPFSAINPYPAGADMRFGRLMISNAVGSEKLNLPMPTALQYFNGTAFVTNAADSCTTLTAANIKLGPYQGGAFTTTVSTNGIFANGMLGLILTKPIPAPLLRGSVGVTVDLNAEVKPYLQGGAGYNQNPTATGTFGVYKGSREIIYLRENY
jgi:hypothetical protein